LAEALAKALNAIRSNGELARVFADYDVSVPAP
jgi:hypothetical protein